MNPSIEKNLVETLTEKIKESVISQISDDKINELINQEIKSFFEPQNIGYNQIKESKFQTLVRNTLDKEIRDRINSKLSGMVDNYWATVGDAVMHDRITASVKVLAPLAMEAFFSNITNSILNNMRNQLGNVNGISY